MALYAVDADVPTGQVTLHRSHCMQGQPVDKMERDGGWREFETRSAALNWMNSWHTTSQLRIHFCHHCAPMD